MAGTQRYAFALVVLFMLSLVFAFGAPPVFAQGFNFPNFNSTLPSCPTTPPPAGVCVNGSATRLSTGNVLELTPNQQFQAGSAWFNTQQAVQQGFTTTFQFRISNPSDTPADGLAFVIQNSEAGTAALGPDGGGIGYGSNPDTSGTGISNSLAVEFDTFPNSGDPNANHVAVQSCGMGANSSDETAVFGGSETPCNLGTSLLSSTLADGSVHTVVINYDPTLDTCGGALKVYLDGNTPILTACVNLASKLSLGTGGTAIVGFTGATGADDENNDILNWSFTPHSGQTTNVILNFTHDRPSQVATFNCTSFDESHHFCTSAEGHSLKLTASEVDQDFSLVVSATIVDGNGVCESGNPNDNTDFDCRFVNHFHAFGTPGTGPVTVPLCDHYLKDSSNVQHCVYYRIENPPDTSKVKGFIDWYAAWNDDGFATGTCPGVMNTGNITYQCDNRQMADDPSDPHPDNDPNQFTQYITTYFNPLPNQVGVDQGLGGRSRNFNDIVVVFPPKVPKVNFILFAPQPNTTVEKTDRLPIVFLLLQGFKLVTNATAAPNGVNVAVVRISDSVQQLIAAPGSPPPTFNLFFGFYVLGLDTSQLAPCPTSAPCYNLLINSNLFTQKKVPFTVVLEDD